MLASLIQTLVSIVIVLGVAVAVGFRATADAASWLAAIAYLRCCVCPDLARDALGLAANSVETASNMPCS